MPIAQSGWPANSSLRSLTISGSIHNPNPRPRSVIRRASPHLSFTPPVPATPAETAALARTLSPAARKQIALLSRYIKMRRANDARFNPAQFAEHYAIMSAQRNTRLLGTFARLNRRDGKPQYLRHQPRIWTYLNRSLAHPSLTGLREWYVAHVPPPDSRFTGR